MCTPRASASTSRGCAYSRSIRSRTRRSRARSRRCCAAVAVRVTWAMVPRPAAASEAEHPRGVVLEDQRPDLVLDLQRREVGEPAVRGEDREVGAEQDLALEQAVRGADELGR